jgi:hypothetical protein
MVYATAEVCMSYTVTWSVAPALTPSPQLVQAVASPKGFQSARKLPAGQAAQQPQ